MCVFRSNDATRIPVQSHHYHCTVTIVLDLLFVWFQHYCIFDPHQLRNMKAKEEMCAVRDALTISMQMSFRYQGSVIPQVVLSDLP